MEMADGKLRAMTAPSKEPKRTKVNPARGKDCGGHITLTLAAKASPSGVPKCVWCLIQGKDGRLGCLTLDPDVNQG